MSETKAAWDAAPRRSTPADELFFWLAFDAIRGDPDLLAVLRKKEAFRHNLLGWISFPGDMTESDNPTPPDFAPLFHGQRSVLLECLQAHLNIAGSVQSE